VPISRHHAARHKAPRSHQRTWGRFAGGRAGVVRTSGVTAAVALVGAAAVAVGIGVHTVGADENPQQTAATAGAGSQAGEAFHGTLSKHRSTPQEFSRSASRPVLASEQRATKAKHLPVNRQALSRGISETVQATDPRDIAMSMLGDHGWSSSEFSCLDSLWLSESNWSISASNSSSGAYGIPQALPGEKMASAGADWRTNPATQIEWGLEYIESNYGSPCSAWYFKEGSGWY
jgi:hypothetical protein